MNKSQLINPLSLRAKRIDLILFIIPFARLFQVEIGGRLYLIDIVLMYFFISSIASNSYKNIGRDEKIVLSGILVWLFGLIISDIYMQSSFADLTRGWSRTILFFVDFFTLAVLFAGQEKRLVIYLVATSIAIAIEQLFIPNEFSAGEPWKFGVGTCFTTLVILATGSRRLGNMQGRLLGVGVVILASTISFYLNSRGLFGLTAGAATIGLLKVVLELTQKKPGLSTAQFAILILGGSVAAWFAIEIQAAVAVSGALGLDVQARAESQMAGDLGVLLGGRAESLASTRAIADSPIIGHGSWARDISYVSKMIDVLILNGFNPNAVAYDDDLIPTHSFILGAWVEAGILGGLFWAYVFLAALRSIRSILSLPLRRPMLIAFSSLGLMWDVLFSPFGADRRFVVPVPILFAIYVIRAERLQRTARAQ